MDELSEIFGEIEDEFLRVAAVSKCSEFLSSRGWQTGETDSKCVFDLFAVKDDRTIKIQIKSTNKFNKGGIPKFYIGRIHYNTKECMRRSYSAEDFDFWFFYHKNGESWIIPFDEVKCNSQVSMDGFERFKI